MSHKTKKLEILDIDDIKSLENKNLSKKVNHYLQKHYLQFAYYLDTMKKILMIL